jgi:poly(glycerol-phosphate) alpha-glucosyltransferase
MSLDFAVGAGNASLSVAILSGSLSRRAGGILPIMQSHVSEFMRAGLKVSVHGPEDPDTEKDRAGWGPVRLYAEPTRLSRFAYAPSLGAGISAEQPDIVHLHGLWQYPSVVADRWRRRTGRPIVISTQGMLEPWALANARPKKRVAEMLFERRNLSSAAVLHCSRAEVEGVRAFGLRNPIAVLPNGATLPEQASLIPPPEFMKGPQQTLLFLGRLHPKKGISETIAAWARLVVEHPNFGIAWRLVIAGWDDGGHAERFKAEASALGLGDRVVFPGPLFGDLKAATLANADAFILASHSEGFPMAVMEAWAYSLPVFMTRECNILEGFREGAAIEITTDPKEISDVLSHHLLRQDLRDVGLKGRTMVEKYFSWPLIAAQIVSVYNWILGRSKMPDFVDLA